MNISNAKNKENMHSKNRPASATAPATLALAPETSPASACTVLLHRFLQVREQTETLAAP
ncbi:hypothetical protein [Undibacterium sp.]|uniref:hypothetical protein n=1 Tax=Undibacterium sp. TaxID=1914977 RepID=UPI00374CBBC7